jgi:hypothetical protein
VRVNAGAVEATTQEHPSVQSQRFSGGNFLWKDPRAMLPAKEDILVLLQATWKIIDSELMQ